MDTINHVLFGFHVALTPINLAYCFAGAFIGTLVGVLPGLGPVTTIAMLFPFTLHVDPVQSLIMLAGIYYGAHHSGSTTAIMLNMPGEPTSIVICFDGHPMARQGRAGVALFASAVGSFFAGCVAVLVIAALSPLIANFAQEIGAVEYTSMIVMALVTAAIFSTRSPITPIAMAALGVLMGTVGTDLYTSVRRFTFGISDMEDGLSIVAAATGLFAFAELAVHAGAPDARNKIETKLKDLIPTRADFRAMWAPILRGTGLGATLGIFPGTGPIISSFCAYALEKQIAKNQSEFGKGAIQGVAAPEAANNAAALTHFIPMLTLGIPAGAANALMLGAMIIAGITPGPLLMDKHPDLFWGVIASMWIGNLMLLFLNLPLVGVWVRLLTIPYRVLYPAVLVFCCIGVYSVNNSVFDVITAIFFGAIGYALKKLDCPPGPLVLGLLLGPLLEDYARRAMLISQGDPTVFFTSPISLTILIFTVVMVVFVIRRKMRAATTAVE